MRALIILAGITVLALSGLAGDLLRNSAQPNVVASSDAKQASKTDKTTRSRGGFRRP